MLGSKSFILISVFIILGFILTHNHCLAGWSDFAGVPVQLTTAKKSTHNDRGVRRLVRVKNTIIALADGVNNNANHEGIYQFH